MGKRRRPELQEGSRPDPGVTFEELVDQYLWYSRQAPDCAFSYRLIGPKGTRYIPTHSLKLLRDLWIRGIATFSILHYRVTFMKSLEHFPSCPSRPSKFGIYFRDLQTGRLAYHGFCTPVAAKSFVDAVIGYVRDEKPNWKGSDQILVGSLQINSNKLEDIMEVEGSIQLPHPYPGFAARIAGRNPEAYIPADTDDAPRERKKRPETAAKAPRAKSAEGSTSASDIAAEIGLEASAARRILRAANVAKPYAWTDQADINRIRHILEKGRKK